MILNTLAIEASWEVVAVDAEAVTAFVTAGDDTWLMRIEADLSGDKRERFREVYGL